MSLFSHFASAETLYESGLSYYLKSLHTDAYNNYRKSIDLLRDAADKGSIKACVRLGLCYEKQHPGTSYLKQDYTEAVKWYRKAAAQNDKDALYALGNCFNNGTGVPQDNEEAVQWFKKAAELGHPEASNRILDIAKDLFKRGLSYKMGHEKDCFIAYMGRPYFSKKTIPQDYGEAVKMFRKAADLGYTAAQYEFGLCCYNGDLVQQNYTEAAQWFKKAAEGNCVEAKYYLGMCYAEGNGVPQDYVKASHLLLEAAKGDCKLSAQAQYMLGLFYEKGLGVLKNYTEAISWFRQAADEDVVAAQYQLEIGYDDNELPRVHADAFERFRKAAVQGDSKACYVLGICYEIGEHVPKDLLISVSYYRQAAEQGYAEAQCKLGDCYSMGIGLAENEKEAVEWYKQASKQGLAKAQYKLGFCCCRGQGGLEDLDEAKSWFRKALEQGYSRSNEGLRYVKRLEDKYAAIDRLWDFSDGSEYGARYEEDNNNRRQGGGGGVDWDQCWPDNGGV